jgi:hypothetical protein
MNSEQLTVNNMDFRIHGATIKIFCVMFMVVLSVCLTEAQFFTFGSRLLSRCACVPSCSTKCYRRAKPSIHGYTGLNPRKANRFFSFTKRPGPAFFCCRECSDLSLTPHLQLEPRLGVSGALPPPPYMPSGYGRTVLPFPNYGIFILHAPRKFHRLKVSFLLVTIATDFVLTTGLLIVCIRPYGGQFVLAAVYM